MKRTVFKLASSLIISISLSFSVLASEKLTSKDFREVAEKVEKLSAQYGSDGVLVALDIDDTILSLNQDLGGEAWFNWQSDLLAKDPQSSYLVAKDFNQLLAINGKIMAMTSAHPTQAEIPSLIKAMQDKGVSVIVVTSRGPSDRDATFRHMKSNGMDFSKTAAGSAAGIPGDYKPYTTKVEKRKLTLDEIKQYKLDAARPVHYEAGILFTAGQHKGGVLKTVLARAHKKYASIVFVDNTQKHLDRMHEAFPEKDVVTFLFNRQDDEIKRFKDGDKSAVTENWKKFKATWDSVFPEQLTH